MNNGQIARVPLHTCLHLILHILGQDFLLKVAIGFVLVAGFEGLCLESFFF